MIDKNQIAARLKDLRNRAGLSMESLALELGMKAASSYQRYEHPDNYARKQFLPFEIALRIGAALDGKGSPPVRLNDVTELAGVDRNIQQDETETAELVRLFNLIGKPVDRQRVLDLLRSMVGE